MHLSPRDVDKLLLHQAGFLAQKRLARGVRLNYPEAVALIATQLLEFIRDGRGVAELMDLGRQLLGRAQVMDGVPEMLAEVQVEGTFPDGSKLVTVHHPVVAEHGNLELALYGSFLPVPPLERFGAVPARMEGRPGEVRVQPGDILLNDGRDTVTLGVTHRGDRPIQVGSHYHFFETNRALVFDRAQAYGRRLDIPAGTAVRFEPGERKTVQLVAIAGDSVVRGGNALGSGKVTPGGRERALEAVRAQGFGHEEERS
ncbi:urease subunit gamma [Myxococcus sp. Y35]|uniref:urease subunit gamma n=1 Tax=Pseudomyxococcus flavus TaxID=3115648 RepID=UPI003CF05395